MGTDRFGLRPILFLGIVPTDDFETETGIITVLGIADLKIGYFSR